MVRVFESCLWTKRCIWVLNTRSNCSKRSCRTNFSRPEWHMPLAQVDNWSLLQLAYAESTYTNSQWMCHLSNKKNWFAIERFESWIGGVECGIKNTVWLVSTWLVSCIGKPVFAHPAKLHCLWWLRNPRQIYVFWEQIPVVFIKHSVILSNIQVRCNCFLVE